MFEQEETMIDKLNQKIEDLLKRFEELQSSKWVSKARVSKS